MPLFRRTPRSPSYQPIRLWLRIKRTLRNALVTGFKWSHLDRFYSIIHDYISQTRVPIDPNTNPNPDQESIDPRWKKSETRFNFEPTPKVAQAYKEVYGKPYKEPKPKFWQFRKRKEAKQAAMQAKAEPKREFTGPDIALPLPASVEETCGPKIFLEPDGTQSDGPRNARSHPKTDTETTDTDNDTDTDYKLY